MVSSSLRHLKLFLNMFLNMEILLEVYFGLFFLAFAHGNLSPCRLYSTFTTPWPWAVTYGDAQGPRVKDSPSGWPFFARPVGTLSERYPAESRCTDPVLVLLGLLRSWGPVSQSHPTLASSEGNHLVLWFSCFFFLQQENFHVTL